MTEKEERVTTSTELEIHHDPEIAPTLFGTSDPVAALERMADVATLLVRLVESRQLYTTISGRKHIRYEGWTALGGMLGVVPVITGTRLNEAEDGFIARCEARTLDGRLAGAAEADCSRAEERWRDRDPYALRAMAQTRAGSRALRAALGQIVVLAGYDAAAVEEMPQTVPQRRKGPRARREQLNQISNLLVELTDLAPATDWRQQARELADGAAADEMTPAAASWVIRCLTETLEALRTPEAEIVADAIEWPDDADAYEAAQELTSDPTSPEGGDAPDETT